MTRAKDISKIVTDADLSGTLDVTGTVTAGGLTLGHQNYIAWADSGGTTRSAFQFDTDTLKIGISGNIDNTIIRSNGADRIKADSNGDISFYEDTGTTPKFFWDASTERLGIGTSSPSAGLHVVATDGIKSQRSGGASISMVAGSTGEARLDTSTAGRVFQVNSNGSISINATTGSGDGDVNIDSSGNVGIGTASPNTALQVEKDWVSDYGSINISHTTNSLGGLGIRCNGVFKSALIYKGGTSGALLDIGTYNAEPILFRTNNTERMRITSGGNIGIGTSSPATPLHISNSSPRITLTDSDAAGINSTISGSSGRLSFNADADNYGTGEILFNQAGTERMRIDSSGNVGIGTSSPSTKLDIAGNIAQTRTTQNIEFNQTNNAGTFSFKNRADISRALISTNSMPMTLNVESADFMNFGTNNTEAMRIDSSGNFMVGKSAVDLDVAGVEFRAGAYNAMTNDGGVPLYLNRLTSDGGILEFRKDGSTVGSIGVNGTRLHIASNGNSGLRFRDDLSAILPCNNDGSNSDGDQNLGASTVRFKTLFLSQGVRLGGTGTANELDDYEEGTWTPQIFSNVTQIATSSVYGFYTKVGDLVHINGQVSRNDSASLSSTFLLRNLPFTSKSGTGCVYVNGGFWFDKASATDEVGFGYMSGGIATVYVKTLNLSAAYITADALENNRSVYFAFTYKTAT